MQVSTHVGMQMSTHVGMQVSTHAGIQMSMHVRSAQAAPGPGRRLNIRA